VTGPTWEENERSPSFAEKRRKGKGRASSPLSPMMKKKGRRVDLPYFMEGRKRRGEKRLHALQGLVQVGMDGFLTHQWEKKKGWFSWASRKEKGKSIIFLLTHGSASGGKPTHKGSPICPTGRKKKEGGGKGEEIPL